MGRPPKNKDGAEGSGIQESLNDILVAAGIKELPPKRVGGKTNLDYYRRRIELGNDLTIRAIVQQGRIPFNHESYMRGIELEAQFDGVSMKDIQDQRTPDQRIAESVERLITAETTVWEEADAELIAMEEGIEKAERFTLIEIEERRGIRNLNAGQMAIVDAEIKALEEKVERGKAMRSRIQRVIRLRRMVRSPRKNDASEAIVPLVFMLYVFRTDTQGMGAVTSSGTKTKMLRIGYHHCRMALTVWMGTNGVVMDAKGVHRDKLRYTDIVLIAPPGHGKSQFLTSYIAWDIFNRLTAQWAYIHAKLEMAQQMIGNSKAVFDSKTAIGRRAAAIYPGVRLADYDNNKSRMRIHLPSPPKSPTLFASGVSAKSLGSDTDRQAFDDVVPQSDVDQPTERERRKALIGGTWTTRQRGKNTIAFHVGYMWHPSDYLSDMVEKISRKKLVGLVDIQRCGGPTETKYGHAFWSLWPEVYPPAELRRRYETMRNRALWSANYEANPLAEEMQVIAKLRYYDPNAEEHSQFVASGMMHVSADPSATNRETSDKAGLVYAGLGEVLTAEPTTNERKYETRVRILDAQQHHVNQVELADYVAQYAMQRPVFQVHIETRGGYHATADIIENKYGLVVQRHDPTNTRKGIRLKQCAGLIDDSIPGIRAVVEFPGIRGADGKVGPDAERWGWLYKQFLRFGYEDDHCLDAVTQLLLHFIRSGDISAGTGEATQVLVQAARSKSNQRMQAWLQSAMSGDRMRGTVRDETAWMNKQSGPF